MHVLDMVPAAFERTQAMPPKRQRIKTLPQVSVGTLMEALSNFCFEQKTRDLYTFLKPLFLTKWKGGPNAKHLSQVSCLYKHLFSTGLAKNGVLPNLHLSLAVQKMVASQALEKPKGADDLWIDRVNQCVRSVAAHWRTLKEFPDALERCLKKASADEVEKVRLVLQVMHIPRQDLPRAPPSISDRSSWRNIHTHTPTILPHLLHVLLLGYHCFSLSHFQETIEA